MDDIMDIAENMGLEGINNSMAGMNYFESQVVTSLVHNCESWIGATDEHVQNLQDLQNRF